MPGTTTGGLPYPLDHEPLADIAQAVQNLAEAVDYVLPAPTATGSNGTSTTGTEVRDDVLGTYVFTARANRRYRVVYEGVQMNSNVANDRYAVRVRNGGGVTPGTADPLLAEGSCVVPSTGTSGRQTILVSGTFVPGAGTVTLAAFTARLSGSGNGTPVSVGTGRELYVVDLGPAS